jgi:hypothetical protein
MKILALEEEKKNSAGKFTPALLKAESRKVWELSQAGIIREIYFRADQPTAVLILECENLKDAQMKLRDLPLGEEGLIYFDLLPLVAYPGYERLFE